MQKGGKRFNFPQFHLFSSSCVSFLFPSPLGLGFGAQLCNSADADGNPNLEDEEREGGEGPRHRKTEKKL